MLEENLPFEKLWLWFFSSCEKLDWKFICSLRKVCQKYNRAPLKIAENIAETGKFRRCGYNKCVFRYCTSCWRHLDQKCIVYYAEMRAQGQPLPNQMYEKFMKSPIAKEQ